MSESPFALDSTSWRGQVFTSKPDGWKLLHVTVHAKEADALASIAGWRNLRGHTTKVNRRCVKSDRAEVLMFVATAWKRPD